MKMETKKHFSKIIVILGFFVIITTVYMFSAKNIQNSPITFKSALDKIIATREIKCGYLVYSPYIRRDPNTGKLSGIFYDMMEQIGKNANLKINWAEEVGFQSIFPSLDNNHFDVFCGGLWPNSTRAMAASFSVPAFYSLITAWVRADSDLKNLEDIRHHKDLKIATIDGAIEDLITRADYPDFSRTSLPELSPFAQNAENIITHKADVLFAEPAFMAEFMAKNPGTLRALDPEHPVRIYSNTLAVKRGDFVTKEFLDHAIEEMVYSGQIDKILAHYEPVPNAFPRLAKPYKE